jgi:hypothetical protein
VELHEEASQHPFDSPLYSFEQAFKGAQVQGKGGNKVLQMTDEGGVLAKQNDHQRGVCLELGQALETRARDARLGCLELMDLAQRRRDKSRVKILEEEGEFLGIGGSIRRRVDVEDSESSHEVQAAPDGKGSGGNDVAQGRRRVSPDFVARGGLGLFAQRAG